MLLFVLRAGQDLDQLSAFGNHLANLFPANLPRHAGPPVGLSLLSSQMMLSIGDLLTDITIVPEEPLRVDDDNPAAITLGGGGQAANFCAWAAKLGEPARLITRVGDDHGGHLLVAEIEAQGVDVRAVWAADPTGAIVVLVGPHSERTMLTQRGASVGLRPEDIRAGWFEAVRLLHVPAYSLFKD